MTQPGFHLLKSVGMYGYVIDKTLFLVMQSTTRSLRLLFTKMPQLYRENRICIEIAGPKKVQAQEGGKKIGMKKARRSKIVKIMQQRRFLDIHQSNDKNRMHRS
jgi:hypothetical protein